MEPAGTPTDLPPVITRSRAVWKGERLFEAGPEGRTHAIDAAAKTAPGPVESLLNAMMTCSAVDVIDILAKRRTPIGALVIEIAGNRRPTLPRRLLGADISYRIDGAGIEREQAERAVRLSLERYCSVVSSLAPDIAITATVVLNGESADAMNIEI
jgi:putative redox protein